MTLFDSQARKAYKTGIKWLVGAGLLTAISLGGLVTYNGLQNRPQASVNARLITVKLGSVENNISEGGTVELGGQRTIKSPEEGAVENLLVALGDRITPGQELIRLRNPQRETILSQKQLEIQKLEVIIARSREKVEEARENLRLAQQQLKADLEEENIRRQAEVENQRIEIEKLKFQVQRNRQKVKEAETELDAAKTELEKLEELEQRGFIAGQEIDRQQQQVRRQTASLRDTQLQLNESIFNLEQAEVKVIPSEKVSSGILQAEAELRQSESELRQILSDLELAKIAYQEEALKLEDYIITSPIEGVILDIDVQPGDGVNRSDDLITIGDPNKEIVKLNLSTLNAVRVQLNQPARVRIIGPEAKSYSGRVTQIDLKASSGNNNDSKQANVPATIQLDKPTGSLIPGSPVSVEIILENQNNVVVVDTELIQRDQQSPYVWILNEQNKAEKQPITLGLEGLLQVEVTSGLNPGDTIIQTSPDESIQPGSVINGTND
ncbi:MAG: efflux RND transporter periplasmic adaptor subunit [Microcoleaceae cyanobacterium]